MRLISHSSNFLLSIVFRLTAIKVFGWMRAILDQVVSALGLKRHARIIILFTLMNKASE